MRFPTMKLPVGRLTLLSLALLVAPATSFALEAEIDVAPNVLNIQSQGAVVTVHTDLSYVSVDVYTVLLNGVEIQSWKADNQGNFVAKFSMNAVKALDGLIIGDYNTLQFVGVTWDGEIFVGEQDVKVINVLPRGR